MQIQTPIVLIAFLIGNSFFTAGCSSTSKETEREQERISNARQELKHMEKAANAEIKKSSEAKEWALFKCEYQLIIANNEMRIAELKRQMDASHGAFGSLFTRQLEDLEQRNAEIKEKIARKDASQSEWDRFQMEIQDEISSYRKSFREITSDLTL